MPAHKFSDPLTNAQHEKAVNYYDFLMNDAQSYNNQRKYQYKNLIKKFDKGIYDTFKGVKMFLHLTNNNKNRFNNNNYLLPNIRYKTAQLIEEEFIENINEYR
jgi:geranylgeranyl pyrophosphate synthase